MTLSADPTAVMRFVDPPQRYAMSFESRVVRQLIPCELPGTYMLYDGSTPVYVGRSDRCLRSRLLSHPYRGRASHVCWQPMASPLDAFRLEGIWFHDLPPIQRWNLAHPARPHGTDAECPGCWAESAIASL